MTAAAVLFLAGLLSAAGNWPYIRLVQRRAAHPRLVTWVIWAMATTTAAIGSFKAGQVPSGLLTAAFAAGCFGVLAFGWRHGHRDIGRLDLACLILAGVGVALLTLAALRPSAVPMSWALTAAVATDLIAFLPTYANGWRGMEPWPPFAVFTAGAVLTLLASDHHVITAMIFPAYLAAADGAMTGVILASPHRARPQPGRHRKPRPARQLAPRPARAAAPAHLGRN